MDSELECEITPSSGNVFRDMGLPDAEELQRKLRLGAAICNAVDRDKPTQAQVAALLGINQPEVSALLPFKLEGFSVERLMRFLLKLGHDAEIVLQAKPKSRAARIAVRAA